MALISKLTSIADEIRNKTGLSDEISLEQMVFDIAMLKPLSIGEVPSYVKEEAERVATLVKALQTENTVTTIHASDIHVGNDAQSRASALHLAQGIHTIKRLVPVDGTFLHGDIVTGGSSDTLDIHLDNHLYARRTLSIADSDVEMDGNHDANSYNANSYMSADELYKYIGRRNVNVVKPTTETNRNYFHYDIKGVRFICLNTGDLKNRAVENVSDGHYISKYQIQWLVDVLGTTASDGISNIVVVGHHPLHWYASMTNVLVILNAFITGTSGSVTVDGETISFDFNGKNSANILGTVHGHTHNLIHGKVGDNEIIRLGTPNGCYGRNNEYGSSAYGEDFRAKYGEETTYSKTANSAKDTAFVVNVWDLEEEIVNSICYGAGYDRMLSWGGVKYYSITNKLTSVQTNNNTASIESGASYEATLSVAENYSIDSITITMGGVDVTNSVYSNGVITISEVTGDIVITAIASGFTNQIPISIATDGSVYNGKGYKEGYRISTSSGNESSASGMSVTGFIPIHESSTIRVKDIDLTSSNSTYAFYVSDFRMGSSGYCNTAFETEDENGVRKFSATNAEGYIRISGAFGEKPIVTVNEEIK